MNQHDNLLSASIYGVLAWQFAVTLMAVAGFLWFYGGLAGISVAFGGCGAGAITGFLAWRMKRLEQQLAGGERVATASAVLSIAPRFLFVMVWFWFGLAILSLQAVPLIVGFALAYLGYLFRLLTALRA